MAGPQNRTAVIDILEKKYEVTRIVTENLCQYMENTRKYAGKTDEILLFFIEFHDFHSESKGNFQSEEYYPDGRFNHRQQIHERLNFLK